MAISLNSTISTFYYSKGLTLESLKRDKEALQRFFIFYTLIIFSFQEALNLDPNDKDT